MFPLWFALVGGSFVFLDVGPSIFVPCFPPFLTAVVNFWLAGFHHIRAIYRQSLKHYSGICIGHFTAEVDTGDALIILCNFLKLLSVIFS
jgi:hypothetical protein